MSLHRPTGCATLAVALLLSACSGSTGPTDASEPRGTAATIEVRPAAAAFMRNAQGAVEVRYAVVNGSDASVLLTMRCGDRLTPAVQRLVGQAWVNHSGGICVTIYSMHPVSLDARARRDEVEFVSSAPPGRYRLVLGTEFGLVASTTFAVQ